MIKEKQPLSMPETIKLLESIKKTDKTKDTVEFLKKFCEIKPEKAEKIRKELENLSLLKVKTADISKIIDVMPEDSAELNKIFTEVTLDADETNKILETIKSNR